jgi:hypothetical protein
MATVVRESTANLTRLSAGLSLRGDEYWNDLGYAGYSKVGNSAPFMPLSPRCTSARAKPVRRRMQPSELAGSVLPAVDDLGAAVVTPGIFCLQYRTGARARLGFPRGHGGWPDIRLTTPDDGNPLVNDRSRGAPGDRKARCGVLPALPPVLQGVTGSCRKPLPCRSMSGQREQRRARTPLDVVRLSEPGRQRP